MLFGFSFGSKDEETTTFSISKSATDIAKESAATSEKTGVETTTAVSEQAVTTLDAETQTLLGDLIQQVGGTIGTTSEELDVFAKSLIERGAETEGILNENIAAIIAEEERSGLKEIGQLQTTLATSAGSTQNSFVAGATAEANAELRSKLAAREGELGIAARDAGTKDLFAAFEALAGVPGAQGQEVANVATLTEALKGATTESVTETEQDTETSETLKTLESIIQAITSKGSGIGTSSSGSSGFNFSVGI